MTQLNLLIVTKLKFTKISPAILLQLVLVNSILSPPWNEAQAFVGETVDSKTDSSDSEFRFNQGENDNNDGNQIKATGRSSPFHLTKQIKPVQTHWMVAMAENYFSVDFAQNLSSKLPES